MSTSEKTITTEKEAIHAVGLNPDLISKLPKNLLTEEVCKTAFKAAPYERTYAWIPEKFRTFAMALKAAPDYGSNTKDFAEFGLVADWGISVSAFVKLVKKKELPNLSKVKDPEIIEACWRRVFNNDPSAISRMPSEFIEKFVRNIPTVNKIIQYKVDGHSRFTRNWAGGELVKFIPEDLMCKETIETLQEELESAVKDGNTRQFFAVDEQYITNELYEAMLEKSAHSLQYIPESRITNVMCRIAVQKDGSALKYVPERWRETFYLDVVKSGKGLHTIPEEDRTDRLCTLAVENSADQYEYVPEDKKSYALSLKAIDGNTQMIKHVPVDQLDEEMMVRLFSSIFNKNYEYEWYLIEVLDHMKEQGQAEPTLTTVYKNYFGDNYGKHKQTELMRDMMQEVIKREPKHYFRLLVHAGVSEERFNGKKTEWIPYFKDVPTFDHAVIAAKGDIELVTAFSLDVQKVVWKKFLENK